MALTLTGNGTITGLAEGGLENAKIIDADIKDDTISEAKLDIHAAPSGTDKFLGYTSNGMEWAAIAAGGGITHIDTWVLTTSFTGDANIITSNLARSTTQQMSQLGTGVTESSGVFTLPATGHWLIIFRCHYKLNGLDNTTKVVLESVQTVEVVLL